MNKIISDNSTALRIRYEQTIIVFSSHEIIYRESSMRQKKSISNLILSIGGPVQCHKLFCFHTKSIFRIFML